MPSPPETMNLPPQKNRNKLQNAIRQDRGIPFEEEILSDRPYRTPKGYSKWADIAASLGMSIASLHFNFADAAGRLHGHRALLWLGLNAPLYCISTPLLRMLQKTDVPEGVGTGILQGMEPPITTALFMPPSNAIKTPSGGCLDYFLFHVGDQQNQPHLNWQGCKLPILKHEGDVRFNIQWSAVDTAECVWFGGRGLDEQGSLMPSTCTTLGADLMNKQDLLFTEMMQSLAIQCWLAACYQPQLLNSSQSKEVSSRRGLRQGKVKYWTPRMLREGQGKGNRHSSKHSVHASPHAHWRRGHWRNQPCGKGRNGRSLVWIKPVLVGEN